MSSRSAWSVRSPRLSSVISIVISPMGIFRNAIHTPRRAAATERIPAQPSDRSGVAFSRRPHPRQAQSRPRYPKSSASSIVDVTGGVRAARSLAVLGSATGQPVACHSRTIASGLQRFESRIGQDRPLAALDVHLEEVHVVVLLEEIHRVDGRSSHRRRAPPPSGDGWRPPGSRPAGTPRRDRTRTPGRPRGSRPRPVRWSTCACSPLPEITRPMIGRLDGSGSKLRIVAPGHRPTV